MAEQESSATTRAPRPWRNPFRFWSDYPVLLRAETKHATEYWLARDEDEFLRSCVEIVALFNEMAYYYDLSEPPPVPPDVSADQIEGLPASLRAAARAEIERYTQKVRESIRRERQAQLLRLALAGDGRAAAGLLHARTGYEYEGVSVEALHIAEQDGRHG